MTIVIGIDPGKSGAVAINENGVWRIEDTPTAIIKRGQSDYLPAQMTAILRPYSAAGDVIVILEQVWSRPGQGVASMFSFGRGYGLWQGILAGLQIPYELVEPSRWKRDMRLLKADKGASVVLAQQLAPSIAGELTGPRGGAKDGRAEAVLLVMWYRQQRGKWKTPPVGAGIHLG